LVERDKYFILTNPPFIDKLFMFGNRSILNEALNAALDNEDPVVINAIYAHHGHEEPDGVESAAVCQHARRAFGDPVATLPDLCA